MAYPDATRLQALKAHRAGQSLSVIARAFHLHRNTLWRWAKDYRLNGTVGLFSKGSRTRHWRRKTRSLENKIIMMKEAEPSLTVLGARDRLVREGCRISPKGIWSAWRRHGLNGFNKNEFTSSYRSYLNISKKTASAGNLVQQLIEDKHVPQAVALVNGMAVFPYPDILMKLPEESLSLPRQLDRLSAEFGTASFSEYRRKARSLRTRLTRQGRHYSALRAGVDEGYALMWLGKPTELEKLIREMDSHAHQLRDPAIRFVMLLFKGHALGSFLQINKALGCARTCVNLIRRLPNPRFFMGGLAGLYSLLGYYKNAIFWTNKALNSSSVEQDRHQLINLAGYLNAAGDSQNAVGILKKLHADDWERSSRVLLTRAFAHLNRGEIQDASSLAIKALHEARREEIRRYFHLATFITACCQAAAGDAKEARSTLKKYIPFFKKCGLEKEYLLRQVLLGDHQLRPEALQVPNIKLSFLFANAEKSGKAYDYRKALSYARSQSLYGLFQRIALILPGPVVKLMKKGKDPGLPKPFLQLPVFSYELPTYNLRFLGRVQIAKSDTKLRLSGLGPKDTAFLIHLARSRDKKIPLAAIYQNFWPKSSSPARNLSHLLVRIRKTLALSINQLRIHNPWLVWNFYLNTDLGHFDEMLAQAKALDRAGEWRFARKEYLRAFKMFRGAPFEKMYDPWSIDARYRILANLETAINSFRQRCQEHHDERVGQKIASKISSILPHLEGLVGN